MSGEGPSGAHAEEDVDDDLIVMDGPSAEVAGDDDDVVIIDEPNTAAAIALHPEASANGVQGKRPANADAEWPSKRQKGGS